jgi:hypothetical protein
MTKKDVLYILLTIHKTHHPLSFNKYSATPCLNPPVNLLYRNYTVSGATCWKRTNGCCLPHSPQPKRPSVPSARWRTGWQTCLQLHPCPIGYRDLVTARHIRYRKLNNFFDSHPATTNHQVTDWLWAYFLDTSDKWIMDASQTQTAQMAA